jgi:hypothetical protein
MAWHTSKNFKFRFFATMSRPEEVGMLLETANTETFYKNF